MICKDKNLHEKEIRRFENDQYLYNITVGYKKMFRGQMNLSFYKSHQWMPSNIFFMLNIPNFDNDFVL